MFSSGENHHQLLTEQRERLLEWNSHVEDDKRESLILFGQFIDIDVLQAIDSDRVI